MNIGLLAVDSNYTNLALMKISAWHKKLGRNQNKAIGFCNNYTFTRTNKIDLNMEQKLKEAMNGLMVTLGTDAERKFAWCLRKVDGKDVIFIHKRENGMSGFNDKDYITAFPVERILSCLKLLL